jgi:hypothetical protein
MMLSQVTDHSYSCGIGRTLWAKNKKALLSELSARIFIFLFMPYYLADSLINLFVHLQHQEM